MLINCESTAGHTFYFLPQSTYSHDVLQLLITYENAKKRDDRQYKLLMDNQSELNVNRFHVLLIISSNNGDTLSIINVGNIMKTEKYNVKPNEQRFYLICNNLENYDSKNKYLLSNVDSHVTIKQIESILFSLCDINKCNNDKYIIVFMKWYSAFNDTKMEIIYMTPNCIDI